MKIFIAQSNSAYTIYYRSYSHPILCSHGDEHYIFPEMRELIRMPANAKNMSAEELKKYFENNIDMFGAIDELWK